MAGDWIKMRSNLDTDPDVVRIASALCPDRFAIVGRLHKVWSWANDHSIDGKNVRVDASFIDNLVGLPGFAQALRDVGWLTGADGSLNFPRFERHNGPSAKRRALDALRKKSVRKTSASDSAKRPHAKRTKSGPEESREENINTPPNPPSQASGGTGERNGRRSKRPPKLTLEERIDRLEF